MDTYGFIAGVVDAAVDVIPQYDRRSLPSGGRAPVVGGGVRPAVVRQTTVISPLARARSPRDNQFT